MYKYNPFTSTLDEVNSSSSATTSPIQVSTFDTDYIVGTESSPVASSFTYNFAGAIAGSSWKVFHSSATIPTFPIETRFISGNYVRNVLNVMTFYYDGTNVLLDISQPNTLLVPSLTNGYKYIANTPPQFGSTVTLGTGSASITSDTALGIYEALSVTAVNDAKGRQSNSSNFMLPNAQDWVMDFTFRINSLSNGTDRYVLFAGLASTSTTPYSANDSVGIIYSDDVNGGKFQLRTSLSGASNNVEDLGITVATGIYEVVMQHIIGTGLTIWINNTLIGTYATTNMPDGTCRNMLTITKTVGTTAIQPIDNGTFNLGV